jgi:hypothetical protein
VPSWYFVRDTATPPIHTATTIIGFRFKCTAPHNKLVCRS